MTEYVCFCRPDTGYLCPLHQAPLRAEAVDHTDKLAARMGAKFVPDVAARAREATAQILGYRDWGDATDYRLTGAEDRERDRVFDIVVTLIEKTRGDLI